MSTDDTAPTERDYQDAAEIATIAWRIYGEEMLEKYRNQMPRCNARAVTAFGDGFVSGVVMALVHQGKLTVEWMREMEPEQPALQ
jgi:methylthioribose-1-phosphate isomerase